MLDTMLDTDVRRYVRQYCQQTPKMLSNTVYRLTLSARASLEASKELKSAQNANVFYQVIYITYIKFVRIYTRRAMCFRAEVRQVRQLDSIRLSESESPDGTT
jgi:hypothetical protein